MGVKPMLSPMETPIILFRTLIEKIAISKDMEKRCVISVNVPSLFSTLSTILPRKKIFGKIHMIAHFSGNMRFIVLCCARDEIIQRKADCTPSSVYTVVYLDKNIFSFLLILLMISPRMVLINFRKKDWF